MMLLPFTGKTAFLALIWWFVCPNRTWLFTCMRPHLDPLQFAYLPDRSTEDAAATVVHEVAQHLDRHPSHYVRCLFIDYSSAFNTIQPHLLIRKLESYNVPANLRLWILDFLTARRQRVRTDTEISEYMYTNTGAPQGCVISAFLFTVYTNDLSCDSDICKIVKYADDTVVMGMITDNDESGYRNTIDHVAEWCDRFYLNLNVKKTKEIIYDFRKSSSDHLPVIIGGDNVDVVANFKYLGVILDNTLKWDSHVAAQIKKAYQRFYHVRCLMNVHIDRSIVCMFYNAVISSVILYALSCWYCSCSAKCKISVTRVYNRICKIVGANYSNAVEIPSVCYNIRTLKLAKKIARDTAHPLHRYFNLLRSGRRFATLRCRTSRFRLTLVPSCIRMLN